MFPRLFLPCLVVGLAGLVLILWGSDQRLAPVYYASMSALGYWQLGGRRWQRVRDRLSPIAWPVARKVAALGYGAVIAEETLVGTLYALAEGFSPALWAERVSQFVSFNLLAFTGAIAGLGLANWLWPGLWRVHFWVAGLWGLFAEGTLMLAFRNPIAAALVAPANIAVYAIILAPMVLCLPRATAPLRLWQIPAAWALMFVFSLGPVAALQALRAAYPLAFPSCDYIGC